MSKVSAQLREAIRSLLEAAIARMAGSGRSLSEFRGTAFYDTLRDKDFTELREFAPASEAIADMDLVRERFGMEEGTRLALQFVYQLVDRLDEPTWSEEAFASLWDDFVNEVSDPHWTFRGVANIRNFRADQDAIDLGDGVVARGRSSIELERLGFHEGVFSRLAEDWGSGFGASSFVLTVEETVAKRPDNFILGNSPELWTKAERAMGALRLLAPGDISLSQLWTVRDARFNVGLGGMTGIGFPIPAIGTPYNLSSGMVHDFNDLYARLRTLEEMEYKGAPGNLDLALRAFMATYDRWPPGADSRLLDSITSLEAVLGSGAELAFKLAFRVASLLAGNDEERASLLQRTRDFYDTRSAIVHGGRLNQKHQDRLNKVDELRALVRTVLRGLVFLATTEDHEYDRAFFKERLDTSLLNSAQRKALRSTMGLA